MHTVLFLFFACFVARYSRTWLTRAKRLPENRFQIPEIPRKIPKGCTRLRKTRVSNPNQGSGAGRYIYQENEQPRVLKSQR